MLLTVVLEPWDEGEGFTALVPALPGCISEGKSKTEALANIRKAVDLYIKTVEEDFTPEAGSVIEKLIL